MGRLRAGDHTERVIQIYSVDNKPFRINWARPDHDSVTVDRPSKGQSLPMHRVLIRYSAGKGLGHFTGTVQVGTDREDCCLLSIPLAGQVEGPVMVNPSSFSIGVD